MGEAFGEAHPPLEVIGDRSIKSENGIKEEKRQQ
jgi:hypothetical protein